MIEIKRKLQDLLKNKGNEEKRQIAEQYGVDLQTLLKYAFFNVNIPKDFTQKFIEDSQPQENITTKPEPKLSLEDYLTVVFGLLIQFHTENEILKERLEMKNNTLKMLTN